MSGKWPFRHANCDILVCQCERHERMATRLRLDEEGRGATPYRTSEELPESVRNALPKHAQDIYRAAFNSAWDEYVKPGQRRGDESREETAHKVAWAAVKHEYDKDESTGTWTAKRTVSGAQGS